MLTKTGTLPTPLTKKKVKMPEFITNYSRIDPTTAQNLGSENKTVKPGSITYSAPCSALTRGDCPQNDSLMLQCQNCTFAQWTHADFQLIPTKAPRTIKTEASGEKGSITTTINIDDDLGRKNTLQHQEGVVTLTIELTK